jgi:hypothetical protein
MVVLIIQNHVIAFYPNCLQLTKSRQGVKNKYKHLNKIEFQITTRDMRHISKQL